MLVMFIWTDYRGIADGGGWEYHRRKNLRDALVDGDIEFHGIRSFGFWKHFVYFKMLVYLTTSILSQSQCS